MSTRRSRARAPFDPALRAAARAKLTYPPVILTGVQARAVGRDFADYARRAGLVIYACAILPEHIHLVVARHRLRIETIAQPLKAAATHQLIAENLHPLAAYQGSATRPPKVFARGQWKVFLDSDADIERSIQYVERNPEREQRPPQRWRFVTPWPAPHRPPHV